MGFENMGSFLCRYRNVPDLKTLTISEDLVGDGLINMLGYHGRTLREVLLYDCTSYPVEWDEVLERLCEMPMSKKVRFEMCLATQFIEDDFILNSKWDGQAGTFEQRELKPGQYVEVAESPGL
jgi:hypothetical protein